MLNIFFLIIRVAFCFAKNRLSGVPLSLQPLPSLRSVQWPPLVPLLSLPRFINQILEIEPNNANFFSNITFNTKKIYKLSWKFCKHDCFLFKNSTIAIFPQNILKNYLSGGFFFIDFTTILDFKTWRYIISMLKSFIETEK